MSNLDQQARAAAQAEKQTLRTDVAASPGRSVAIAFGIGLFAGMGLLAILQHAF